MTARMRFVVAAVAVPALVLAASAARAQEPPPRIGPFVLDLHASVPRFPSDDPQLALSREMDLAELPGTGLGIQVGAHVYVLRVKAITFGLGAEFAAGRSRQTPQADATSATTGRLLRPSEERFSTIAPQLSFNFGNGHGWSYLSGGLGTSNWAVVPQGQEGFPADSENLKTLNYGGGARWFAKSHLAFSLDVRIYAISPGTPFLAGAPGSPRTNLLVIATGVSVK
ncbi:MAG: hypothetical protein DMF93_22480 [Acidobacteria bacterium]|nr:MAG: hypothetical protein DMF93_22480 [Acidobacteriota bacterium]